MTDVYTSATRPRVTERLGEGHHIHKRIAWTALFAGVVLALALQIVLSLLGMGIGFSTVDVATGGTPSASSFGIGTGVWWIVTSCVSLFAGGYVAAWLAGTEGRFDGMLHGLVTWGMATIVTIYLLTTAIGGIVGGGFSALTSVVSGVGSGVKSAAAPVADVAGISPDTIRQQAMAYLQPASADPATMSPEDAQKAIAGNLVTYERGGADAPAAKQRIIDITAAQMKISQTEATQKFDAAQAKIDKTLADAKQKAESAADASAAAASKTAFALFVVLLLGAIAAAIGGAIGIGSRFRDSETSVART